MKDITCPYCEEEFDLCHDDGAYTDQSDSEEWECPNCEKISMVSTYITFSHEIEKADCLNEEAEHMWKKQVGHPAEYFVNKYICEVCGETKQL